MNLIWEQGLLLNNMDIKMTTVLENFLDAPNYDVISIMVLWLATLNSQHEGLYLIKTITESTYWSIWFNCFRLHVAFFRQWIKQGTKICKMELKQQLSIMSLLPINKLLN